MNRLQKHIQAAILVLGVMAPAAPVLADASPTFNYETSHKVTVDLTFANVESQSLLLSFYSKGENGVRLLENAFTDAQGHYEGDLLLPMHVEEIDVVVRGADRQDTYTLSVNGDRISHAE
jgi:hypothetical protein